MSEIIIELAKHVHDVYKGSFEPPVYCNVNMCLPYLLIYFGCDTILSYLGVCYKTKDIVWKCLMRFDML
jgi:hypothetical protein